MPAASARPARRLAERADARALAEVAGYARAIGADKDLVIPRDGAGNLLAPSSLVADAHAAGLLVHAWTFRAEADVPPREHP